MSVNLTKLGIFFDGSYFSGVSSYYLHHHERRARISLNGIRNYVTHHVALEEGVSPRHCRIVESHLFAGRISALDARERDDELLFRERQWDDILQKEDVTAHYLPMGLRGEKGIDVALALECYEAVTLKGLDVVVLVTGDGDFVPLVRKLNARGVRVMVAGASYSYLDHGGRERAATVSRALLAEATYPVQLDERIERYAGLPEDERQLIDGLFLKPRRCEPEDATPSVAQDAPVAPAPDVRTEERAPAPASKEPVNVVESGPPRARRAKPAAVNAGPPASRNALERLAQKGFANGAGGAQETSAEERITGRVIRVLDGYGFIQSHASDATPFFHYSEVAKRGFDHIQPGTPVSFVQVKGDRGPVAKSVRLVEEEETA